MNDVLGLRAAGQEISLSVCGAAGLTCALNIECATGVQPPQSGSQSDSAR